jgi:hypothetical protein
MVKPIGNDSHGERLDIGPGIGLGGTAGKHARQRDDVGDPAAVRFSFDLDAKGHRILMWGAATTDI